MTLVNWTDIIRGDTDEFPFTITILGSTDITAAEVRCTARLGETPVLALANVAAGGDASQIAITTALSGQLSVYLKTTDLPVHLFPRGATHVLDYDLEVTRADGVRKTVMGTMTVTMDRTR